MNVSFRQHPLWQRLSRLPLTVSLLSLLAAGLAASLLLTTTLFNAEMGRYRAAQQAQLGDLLGRQSAQLAAGQILAQDWVSLTVTANQLVEHPQVVGAVIVDARGESLAQAGISGESYHATPIQLNQTPLGEVRLQLDQTPLTQQLSLAFYRTTLAALVTVLGCWLLMFVYLRRLNAPLQGLVEASEALAHDQPMPRLNCQRGDELGRICACLNQRFAPLPEPEDDMAATAAAEEPCAAEPLAGLSPSAAPTAPMPTEAAAPGPEPIRYLLYVDHRSTASDNLTAAERATLLEPYRRSLEQVSQLYQGRFELDDEGNWWVGFEPLDATQSHGINALCAAQLFNALYRGTNQRAIRQMTPVANIKMSLLCGGESFAALLQEAPLLCRAVEANQLIVDEQLFAIAPLVERLLKDAQCRSLEQPARLLSSLGADYQSLIEQQAEHFLRQP